VPTSPNINRGRMYVASASNTHKHTHEQRGREAVIRVCPDSQG
jgi:hypothetical protein